MAITKRHGLKTNLLKILMKLHDKKLSWIPEDRNLEVWLSER